MEEGEGRGNLMQELPSSSLLGLQEAGEAV